MDFLSSSLSLASSLFHSLFPLSTCGAKYCGNGARVRVIPSTPSSARAGSSPSPPTSEQERKGERTREKKREREKTRKRERKRERRRGKKRERKRRRKREREEKRER